jgi:hypothetical protein
MVNQEKEQTSAQDGNSNAKEVRRENSADRQIHKDKHRSTNL